MEYKDPFEKEIITRTLSILDGYTGPYEDTLFLNLCVGLLIVPKENVYALLPKEDVTLIKWFVDPSWISYSQGDDKSVQTTVRHMRNAIAHSLIRFYSQDSCVITHVEIEDRANGIVTFKAMFEIAAFKNFVLKVAQLALSIL